MRLSDLPLPQQRFIRALSIYLVKNDIFRGLEAKRERDNAANGITPTVQWATEWVKLRGLSPISGYIKQDEAEQKLVDFLWSER